MLWRWGERLRELRRPKRKMLCSWEECQVGDKLVREWGGLGVATGVVACDSCLRLSV